ncbi:RNA ligase [Mycobacterium phage Phrappuccino]|uniref:RNA ligase n=1 Tax=Mycobacterium phage Phrappuccino TaxID=2591223 RepID=A0A514DDN9_9CAUD|nr:RNA ligase [Mycobacterium phage Phrappuccino]QDH91725.1 RNA ligase [Mycobacterium phage Phrappuccino]QIQ63168.1 RNA ligase [Mycobacterium phage Settecandela]
MSTFFEQLAEVEHLVRLANSTTGSRYLEADAEQAKQTGGMVALYPRRDIAEAMAVQGGEPVEDIHLTLCYLGENVTDLPVDGVAAGIGHIADMLTAAVHARVMGHAIFNPDGGPTGEMDPCCVYLVSDSDLLTPLREAVHEVCEGALPEMPKQHEPFLPHMTAAYAMHPLDFTGEVIFDRLTIEWAGQTIDFPLLDS